MSWSIEDEVEDVEAIVHERDGLRVRVQELEIEIGRLRAIIAGYRDLTPTKVSDAKEANVSMADRKRTTTRS